MVPMAADDAPPPPSPAERRGQIEVDVFCGGCHYNLHGQTVAVDERLGIPVCRCPECGRFHPAGTGVTASSVWVRRLATTLLLGWVGTVLAGTLVACFFLGLLSAGTVEAYAHTVLSTPDGREAEYAMSAPGAGATWYLAGTNTPVPVVLNVYKLYPIVPPVDPATAAARYGSAATGPGPTPWLWLSAGSLVLGGLIGGLAVTLLWHWPRRRYGWGLLVPAVPMAVLSAVYATADLYLLIRGPATGRAGVQFAIQCLGILVGLRVGRPIARAVVRTVVPPKPRQALAFLWQVDGKQLPG